MAQSVQRALRILSEFIAPTVDEIGISALARHTELSPSTVHRLLQDLVAEGFIAKNPETTHYALGAKSYLLASIARDRVGYDKAQPILDKLGEKTTESVNLGVRDRREVLVVLHVDSHHDLKFHQLPGTRKPMHCTSIGKALLAFGRDVEQSVRNLGRLERYSENTIVNSGELLEDVRITLDRGYSVDDEESAPGVRCVGVPILDDDGFARAGLAVQAPTVRMPYDRIHEDLAPAMFEASAKLQKALTFG